MPKKPPTNRINMVKAEDGTFVPKSFYDVKPQTSGGNGGQKAVGKGYPGKVFRDPGRRYFPNGRIKTSPTNNNEQGWVDPTNSRAGTISYPKDKPIVNQNIAPNKPDYSPQSSRKKTALQIAARLKLAKRS